MLETCWPEFGTFVEILNSLCDSPRDVSNEAMRNGEVGGLWRLNLLTASLSVMPLVLLPLLPKSEEDQERLSKDKSKSRLGGIVFITVLIGSVVWTFVVSFWRLFATM